MSEKVKKVTVELLVRMYDGVPLTVRILCFDAGEDRERLTAIYRQANLSEVFAGSEVLSAEIKDED